MTISTCPASGHMEWSVPGYVSPQAVGNDISAAMQQANACWGTPGASLPSGSTITSQITGAVSSASAQHGAQLCQGCRLVAYQTHQFSPIRTLILVVLVLAAIVAAGAVLRVTARRGSR